MWFPLAYSGGTFKTITKANAMFNTLLPAETKISEFCYRNPYLFQDDMCMVE